MISGRDALHRIDAAIAEARHTLGEAGAAAGSVATRLAEIRRQEEAAYSALASVRIDLISAEELDGILRGAEAKAAKLLTLHETELNALDEKRERGADDIKRLEEGRRIRETALDEAIEAHDEASAATLKKLELDPNYQARADAVDEANAVALRAAQKLEVAHVDRKEKGAPYEADPLFSYLHKRRFGKKDYRAFILFAGLDRWVARLIGYRDARLNYDRLLELTERLDEHATRKEADAVEAARTLEAFERETLELEGVGGLRDKAATARRTLEEIDESIAGAEERHQTLAREYANMADGQTGPLSEARALIADDLERRSIPDLMRLAAATTTLEDDQLVDDLIRLKREQMEVEDNHNAISASLDRKRRQLGDLEDIRRRFKQARYDSPYSEFPNRNLIGVLLSDFILGSLSRDQMWRKISRSQRSRAREWDIDLGGDEWRDAFGLPQRARRGNPWGSGRWSGGSPSPRRPRRTPRPPRIKIPRSRGRGGFKTGGGF